MCSLVGAESRVRSSAARSTSMAVSAPVAEAAVVMVTCGSVVAEARSSLAALEATA